MDLNKIMERLFLYKVYKFNKKLFIFFTGFAMLSLICNITGNEITPFYVWGMYSEKEVAPVHYEIFRVQINNNLVDYSTGFLPENRLFLLSPLTYYASMKNAKDPTEVFLKEKLKDKFAMIQPYAKRVLNSQKEVNEFPSWYRRYLQQTTGKIVQNLKVEVLNTSYDIHNNIRIDSTYTLIDER
ncbi:MAG: hypothetical protein Q8891_01190 [Bacteroidota bacterium]|nr:hypothetical protein [Bacteroidota bacterium]